VDVGCFFHHNFVSTLFLLFMQGATVMEVYDKIRTHQVVYPENALPELVELLDGLLCKGILSQIAGHFPSLILLFSSFSFSFSSH
jgi:hypothetical protein